MYDGRDPPENTLRKFFHLARGFDLKDKITFQDFTYFARCARIAHKSKPRPYAGRVLGRVADLLTHNVIYNTHAVVGQAALHECELALARGAPRPRGRPSRSAGHAEPPPREIRVVARGVDFVEDVDRGRRVGARDAVRLRLGPALRGAELDGRIADASSSQ